MYYPDRIVIKEGNMVNGYMHGEFIITNIYDTETFRYIVNYNQGMIEVSDTRVNWNGEIEYIIGYEYSTGEPYTTTINPLEKEPQQLRRSAQ